MTPATVGQLSLRLRLMLAHCGWLSSLGAALCVLGTTAWLWGLPQLEAQVNAQNAAISHTRQALNTAPAIASVTPPSTTEQKIRDFYDTLGEEHYSEQQIKSLFSIAAKNSLILNQAEYKAAYDLSGRFHTYRILLPIKGPYFAIREFCEQVLLVIPFASLDELHFKRESIANPLLEANLHLTLHLRAHTDGGTPGASRAEQQPERDL